MLLRVRASIGVLRRRRVGLVAGLGGFDFLQFGLQALQRFLRLQVGGFELAEFVFGFVGGGRLRHQRAIEGSTSGRHRRRTAAPSPKL